MDQLLYTVAQCCRMTATGRTKIYQLLATGEIPSRKVGRKRLVAASDLLAWVDGLPAFPAMSTKDGNRKTSHRD
jgi:excisionase family DNA binding protein